ncbi:Quaternary ammonium compound-resistance protein qacE [Bibersteinia trehalosi USDA-ARS-USMARC-188]|uniref:Quaternary ammonium compound-resistance protein qacE n=1 Tax=Bibersteinia trehalosi USDA-ARS-USMARC-188 TaxID=1263829 RepID=A0A4V7ICT8_BIBTR|nr:multidrug efflux SMR transporter [Bibersteinia trehalosi]AHG82791.1 Quaternary ammonium compound-resistance protein qacE [Bibersteinia trehalosi USDA-ARS-USMARC-188]
MHWSIFLAIAVCSEVFGSTMIKLSQGFTKPLPSVGVAIGFALAFYCLSLTLKSIPLGMAYAIWSGVGLVLTAIVGVVVFGEKVDFWGMVSIALILAGVIMMNTLSKMGGH